MQQIPTELSGLNVRLALDAGGQTLYLADTAAQTLLMFRRDAVTGELELEDSGVADEYNSLRVLRAGSEISLAPSDHGLYISNRELSEVILLTRP